MKKENGITMISLVIYIAIMIIVVTLMATIISNFYKNTDTVQSNVQEIIEFNKFNSYFLKEVKTANNEVESVEKNKYILFKTGNTFSFSNNGIYYNNIKICKNVQSIYISFGKNGNENDRTIINVTINFKSFNKTITYKIEDIY